MFQLELSQWILMKSAMCVYRTSIFMTASSYASEQYERYWNFFLFLRGFFCGHKLGSCPQSYKTRLHFRVNMKNMQMFCTVYKSTKVYWVKKQKLFVSLQRARREVGCLRVCSSVHANMRIKAAGWDGFGSDVDPMGRPTSSWRSIVPSSSTGSLPHGVFFHRWAPCRAAGLAAIHSAVGEHFSLCGTCSVGKNVSDHFDGCHVNGLMT